MSAEGTRLFPFVPSGPDFAKSTEFFKALGFEVLWQHDRLAALQFGGAFFLLQDINVPEWQKNQMIVLEVSSLDSFWADLDVKGVGRAFPGVKLRPPTEFPWGREVHIIDPAGVCWHVRQTA
jgi:catechol 2,3-dioxygenase-like lactoylglutathione lyase family enzyme